MQSYSPTLACEARSRFHRIKTAPQYRLSFTDVYMVMNMYRLEVSCDSMLQGLFLETDWNAGPPQYGLSAVNIPQITKCRVKLQITSGSLMIQTKQHMLIFREIYDLLEAHGRHYTIGETVGRTLLVCQDRGRSNYIERIVDKAVTKLVEGRLGESAGYALVDTVRCSCCLPEFKLAIYNHPDQGFEVALTTWVNLGSCGWDNSLCWYLATSENLDSTIFDTSLLDIYKEQQGYPSDHEAVLSVFLRRVRVAIIRCITPLSHPKELLGLAYISFVFSALAYCSSIGAFKTMISILGCSICLSWGAPRNTLLPRILPENMSVLRNFKDDGLVFFRHNKPMPKNIVESAFAHQLANVSSRWSKKPGSCNS